MTDGLAFIDKTKGYRLGPIDGPVIKFPAGLVTPSRLLLTVEDPEGYDLELEIAFEGDRYVCRELRMRQREGGPPVTGEALRDVTVRNYVRTGIRLAVMKEEQAPDGTSVLRSALGRKPPKGLAKQGPTDEVLRWVAQIYGLAVALNEPPTKSVQDELGVSRATAGRWVAEARNRGLLPPLNEGEEPADG